MGIGIEETVRDKPSRWNDKNSVREYRHSCPAFVCLQIASIYEADITFASSFTAEPTGCVGGCRRNDLARALMR